MGHVWLIRLLRVLGFVESEIAVDVGNVSILMVQCWSDLTPSVINIFISDINSLLLCNHPSLGLNA
ncbi:hypothetical protein DAI22_10g066100 [Oryza sativa Japonica Group]|nr:hypothetical protein DAI22_10g066100 [Oryza sativa Japonica Group]